MGELTDTSELEFFDLHMRDEGEEWIVGRVDSGRFIALPSIGARVISLLREGRRVGSVREELREELGQDINVAGLATSLSRVGFVRAVDGVAIPADPPMRSAFPAVAPEHVRFMAKWRFWAPLGIIALAVVAMSFAWGDRVTPAAMVWSQYSGICILTAFLMAWASIFLHELTHLFSARALGVPGRISLGTRLQFLAAETDVSGVWVAPRRMRILVYSVGMILNAALLAASCGIFAFTAPGLLKDLAGASAIVQANLIVGNCLFFMRTDVYFIIQDLARCRDLFGDATALFGYQLRRVFRRPSVRDVESPLLRLPVRERRWVRLYALLMVPATAVCVGFFAVVTLPATILLLGNAWRNLLSSEPLRVADGVIVLTVTVGMQIVWFWVRLRRRRRAVLDAGGR